MSLESFARYPLLFGPSPVHRLDRLTKHLGGATVWAKREDCNSGLAFGGNKGTSAGSRPSTGTGRCSADAHPRLGDRRVIDFSRFDVLTFDCYGTLIDWEAGILAGLHAVLDPRGVTLDDEDLLVRYARHEAAIEAGPYLPYREVLARGLERLGAELGIKPEPDECAAFGGSVADWPAFPDSAGALTRLHERFQLAVITNCDDDLFAASNRRLGVDFDFVITAQQARGYKPGHRNFELAFERIGRPRDRILHVAQSLFHDHVPAKALGLTTAWINRRHDRPGSGATPPAEATPDLVAPDMATFAGLATA